MTELRENIKTFFRQQGDLYPSEIYMIKDEISTVSNASEQLKQLEQVCLTCTQCHLSETRTKVVFGAGNPDADLLFVGEAPGMNEDLQGLPFVGRAGNLLDKILAAIGLKREQVYIANVLKCRPPGNRTPNSGEVEKCEPYLLKQIEIIRPKLIICLGLTAARTLLRVEYNLENLRGQIFRYHNVDLIVTYHPAALLRNENLKKYTWEDFKKIKNLYLDKTGE
ncbi:MAG: uracil-DNA glycosylase [Candidatus Marinimicrobia bacterium]|nr:uracil-DNA glycosylase [Candidatus Neomarinimicrobiota bacterium]